MAWQASLPAEKFRADIGQGSQNKLPCVQSRVRQLQSFVTDSLFAAVEQIDIDDSRNVLWMIAFAA